MSRSMKVYFLPASLAAIMPLAVCYPARGARMIRFDATIDVIEEANRDKKGTTLFPATTNDWKNADFSANKDAENFEAEGMGLEPTTGFPAPEFQSGR